MKLNTQNAEFVLSAARLADCPRDRLPQIAFAGRSNVGKSRHQPPAEPKELCPGGVRPR